jgi:uncharacterized protein (DUF2267 family)
LPGIAEVGHDAYDPRSTGGPDRISHQMIVHRRAGRLHDEDGHVAHILGAQLPMLIRGFYYEGWHPAGTPTKERRKEDFLEHIAAAFRGDPDIDPEQVARAVFEVLAET